MKIFVVMPNYSVNNEVIQLAQNAIKSFKESSDCTVVVVDDVSPLDVSAIENVADVFIKRDTNGGFSTCCNTGFKYALENDADYIVCANTDIEVPKGWVEEFLSCIDIHRADLVAGLGYKHKGAINEKANMMAVSEGGLFEDWLFPGAFWLMKRSVMEEIGLLDENYKHGGIEDIDYFYRAKLAGKRLIMTPRVWYWHKEGATRYSEEERGRQSVAIKENEEYFKRKFSFDCIKHLTNKILKDNRINL